MSAVENFCFGAGDVRSSGVGEWIASVDLMEAPSPFSGMMRLNCSGSSTIAEEYWGSEGLSKKDPRAPFPGMLDLLWRSQTSGVVTSVAVLSQRELERSHTEEPSLCTELPTELTGDLISTSDVVETLVSIWRGYAEVKCATCADPYDVSLLSDAEDEDILAT